MEFIEFKGEFYPEYQAKGNAAQWIMPFAKEWCKGNGLDIGCNREEWALPGSTMIDLTFDDDYHAMNLPDGPFDYIFSSHCLEHISDWIGALEYWATKLISGGTLFLYLPHETQKYWHPVNNRKHFHSFNQNDFDKYFDESKQWSHFYSTGSDLNNSFCVIFTKA